MKQHEQGGRDGAKEFLADVFARHGDTVPSAVIKSEAKAWPGRPHWATLKAARADLGIDVVSVGFPRITMWVFTGRRRCRLCGHPLTTR